MLYEYMSASRIIRINAKHPDDLVPAYMGDSVGHWDGDTLVVDVTGFNDKTWLAGTGTFHSEELHLTERFTRVSKDRINYEVVMEDPKVLTKPWRLTSSLMLREGTRLQEYICAENNLDPGAIREADQGRRQVRAISREISRLYSPLVLSFASLSLMKVRMSSAMSSSRVHCSL